MNYEIPGASSFVVFFVGTEILKGFCVLISMIGQALTQTVFNATSSSKIGYMGAGSYNEKFWKLYCLLGNVC